MGMGHVARLEMHLGDAPIIARDEAVEDLREEAPSLLTEPAHDAEIDGDQRVLARPRTGFPGCMSAWKKPGARAPGAGRDWMTMRASASPVMARGFDFRDLRKRHAVDPFERSAPPSRCAPNRRSGTRKSRIVVRCSRPIRKGRCLEPRIHLDRDRARQRLHHGEGRRPAHRRSDALDEPRAEAHIGEIALEARLDAGTQDLDGDASAPDPPRRGRALCSWAMEAAATGSPNSAKIVGEPAGRGRPRS